MGAQQEQSYPARKGLAKRTEDWRDKAFIAEVPEPPGCAADGKTHREALANVEVLIAEWIETANEVGRTVPAPKGRLVFA